MKNTRSSLRNVLIMLLAVAICGCFLVPATEVEASGTPGILYFSPNSGGQGSFILIVGANFTGATGVSFGGMPAAGFFISPDGSQIMAIVGTGSSGAVNVITSSGTASSPGFTFIPPPAVTSFSPASGSYGTQVTITGNNLSGATAVSFGSNPAQSFHVDSSTQITAVVDGGGTGVVKVVTPGGTATKDGFTFFLPPTLTEFFPTSAGNGATVIITGVNLSGATAVSFGNTPAQSFTVDSDTQIAAIVDGGASGAVSVTTPGGTANLYVFSYVLPPAITSFSPVMASSGTLVTINGTNLAGVTALTFGGVPP